MRVLLWVLHHFVRPIWSTPLKAIFYCIALFRLLHNSTVRSNYSDNTRAWDKIETIENLVAYFKTNWKYKWDGYFGEKNVINGIFDHDNSKLEFFTGGGDCDDAATFPLRELSKMGFKATKIGMMLDVGWHYDVAFESSGHIVLFNQGYMVSGADFKEATNTLSNRFKGFHVKYWWKCLW